MYHLFELVPGATNCTPPGAMTESPHAMQSALTLDIARVETNRASTRSPLPRTAYACRVMRASPTRLPDKNVVRFK